MRLFTPQERYTTINIIVEELKKIDGIIAIIIVGSGAVGFTDDISDLDFSIVIDNDGDINAIMKRVSKFICTKWKLIDALEIQKRSL